MKRNLLYILCFTFCAAFSTLNAQIPNGTTAPDWTATDLDGVSHNMYDMLNSGKHVVLEFSATWCGPCWNFHNTGTLETLYETYGPDGTDQIRVFYIESDLNTNTDCLYNLPGCNSSTQGNWVAGTNFPFIDCASGNASGMPNDYQVGYYPTVYAISANGTNGVYEVGQETSIANWAEWFFESFELTATPTTVDAWCPGEGSILMNTTNGAGSLDFNWSNGAFGNYIDGLSTGSYTVTITDDNGYELIETVEVDGPTDGPLDVELLASADVNCNGENSGALNIGGTGGNGGFIYSWNNGSTSDYLDGLVAGVYEVTVTDALGCTTEETYVIEEPETLVLSALPEDANCGAEDGQVVAFAVGGVGPWSYDYGDGPNFTGTFYDVAPGDYVMSVTDDNGCTDMKPFTIEATEGPTVAVAAEEALDCNTNEVTVSGAGSDEGDNIEYSWTSESGEIVSGEDEIDVVVSAAGTYTLQVTNTETGCSESMSIDVAANIDAPIAMIDTPSGLDCTNEMTSIDASQSSEGDNITYSWSTDDGNILSGATTTMIEVDAGGTYSLLVTNTENGCTTIEDVVISEDIEEPNVAVDDFVLDCSTTEAELCADVEEGTTVTWTTPNGEVEAECITVDMAGSFTATARGANGCEASAVSNVTLSSDLPQVSIATPEPLTCTSTSTVVVATIDGDITDLEIVWTDPLGNVIPTTDLSIDATVAGEYVLDVTNSTNGCMTTSSTIVDEIIIIPEAGFSTELVDGTLIVTSNSTGDPSIFDWSFGSSDENSEVIFDENGTYQICLTVSNDCGDDMHCQDVEFVTQLNWTKTQSDILCNGENNGEITVTPEGGLPGYTIAWVGPNGFTATDLTISNLAAGEYSMVLNDDFGYEKSGTFTISEATAIEQTLVEITDETNSDGNGSISIELTGGEGELTYNWSNGATTATIQDLASGDYFVEVTDENGCTVEFGPFTVESTIVGVEDLDIVRNLSVYPIPANNYVNVSIELFNAQQTQMRVIDTYGKVITVQNFNQKDIYTTIDVSDLPAGMYFIEFGNETGKSLEKFVVIR